MKSVSLKTPQALICSLCTPKAHQMEKLKSVHRLIANKRRNLCPALETGASMNRCLECSVAPTSFIAPSSSAPRMAWEMGRKNSARCGFIKKEEKRTAREECLHGEARKKCKPSNAPGSRSSLLQQRTKNDWSLEGRDRTRKKKIFSSMFLNRATSCIEKCCANVALSSLRGCPTPMKRAVQNSTALPQLNLAAL